MPRLLGVGSLGTLEAWLCCQVKTGPKLKEPKLYTLNSHLSKGFRVSTPGVVAFEGPFEEPVINMRAILGSIELPFKLRPHSSYHPARIELSEPLHHKLQLRAPELCNITAFWALFTGLAI